MRINYIFREPHAGGGRNMEEDWGMAGDQLSILQARRSLYHNSAESGETRKLGRKSRNRDLKPGQIHSNASRDLESWAQILTRRGNLVRKHLFSKNNNRGASILWGTHHIHAQEVGGKVWPLAPSSQGMIPTAAHDGGGPSSLWSTFMFLLIHFLMLMDEHPLSSPLLFTYPCCSRDEAVNGWVHSWQWSVNPARVP